MRAVTSLLRSLVVVALAAAPLFAASCQNIIGINDRTLGPCGHYCDVVMANCTGADTVYDGREKCMGVCQHYDVGDSNEWQMKNTLECRLHEAELVPSAAEEDRATLCRAAGPEGLTNCGGSCESYCSLYEEICGQVECGSHENCVAKCAALRDRNEYNVVDDYEGDSLQCRFVHLSNASITPGGEPHCGHANLSTPTDHCTDVPDAPTGAGGSSESDEPMVKPPAPDCDDYCRVQLVACDPTGPDAQYENHDECMAVCQFFTVGQFADTTQNTLGCRLYHSYNALCSPDLHCPHSGPGGEGQCGTNATDKCASYCQLAKGACPDLYADDAVYGNDDTKCMNDCTSPSLSNPTLADANASAESGDTRYTLAVAQTPGTLACRFLALSRAAADPTKCGDVATSPVFGHGVCAKQ
ncbi:MAG TPA: hypothetical protein VMI54_12145 [Polyangiaceae bacterium]|nr:hypothetical protein [Polyangiaceae bacterium]